jgi:hypothetical protein
VIGSGIGSAGINKPIFCNGANLMFEKKIYMELNDPLKQDIISGDDTFLLHQVKKIYPLSIKVLKSADALVLTRPGATIKDFMNQRIRWTSKSRYYNDKDIIVSGSVVFFSCLVVVFWLAVFFVHGHVLYFILFSSKLTGDWIFLSRVLAFFKKQKLHVLIPLGSIFYPVYIICIAIYGNIGKYNWKGRRYRS